GGDCVRLSQPALADEPHTYAVGEIKSRTSPACSQTEFEIQRDMIVAVVARLIDDAAAKHFGIPTEKSRTDRGEKKQLCRRVNIQSGERPCGTELEGHAHHGFALWKREGIVFLAHEKSREQVRKTRSDPKGAFRSPGL